MIKLLKPYTRAVIVLFIYSLISNIAYVMTPLLLGFAIDDMSGSFDMSKLVYTLFWAGVLYVVQFVTGWLLNMKGSKVSLEITRNLRNELERKITKLPISYFDTHNQGEIQNYFASDTEVVYEGIYQMISQGMSGITLIVLVTIFMVSISWLMTLIVYATLPIVYFASSAVTKRGVKYYRETQRNGSLMVGSASEYIDMHRLVMTYNYQDTAIKNFKESNEAYNKVGVKAQIMSALVNPTTRIVNNISYVLVGVGGIYSIANMGLSVGLVTTFISYSLMFSKPFTEMSAVMAQITSAQSAYERINAFLNLKEEYVPNTFEELDGKSIEFRNVSFSYDKEHPMIQNFDLKVEPLSKVAIVGPTGAGKSTLINLLMRFYSVDEGSIIEDGFNIDDLNYESTRKTMGMVLQEPWLFEGTIRENLLFGNDQATQKDLEAALEQAGCLDKVNSLDQGLDTWVTLGSTNLSLGEKQLLTIARALLTKAPILILDEATSNVDVLTEKHIQQVFTKIMKSHTSFFVAHHLSTVTDSDLILVMNKGRLIESGTHLSLMEEEGFYYKLYTSHKAVGN